MPMSWGPYEGLSLTKLALVRTRQDDIIYVSKFGLWSCTLTNCLPSLTSNILISTTKVFTHCNITLGDMEVMGF
jgi:hypothetical protein